MPDSTSMFTFTTYLYILYCILELGTLPFSELQKCMLCFVFLHFEHSKNGFLSVYLMYIFPGCLCEYGLEYGLSYWVTCITCDPLFLHTVPSSIFDFRSANNKRPALL